MGLRTNSIPRSVSFRFFNKIISCGRRREDQGLGPPPLWSVAGEGGLCSGLEGSVGYGGRGLVPRPEPKFGGGGASSFGLRLRTGERCSRRGRSAGAWSWSSCTDTARRPAERGLGLSWPSRGGQDIRVCHHTLPPHSNLQCSQRSQVPSLGVGCLPTFIPRAQAGVLWETQDVWGRAGSSGTWAGTWRGGPWTILLAPTTASELCIQLLPQCLPGGRLRPLASWPRST